MGRVDSTKRIERLRAIGMRGKLPDVLTETVLEAVRMRPQGESYTLADGRVPGLALEVGASGAATWWLWYRTTSGQRRHLKLGAVGAVTLELARELAMEALVAVGRGEDPALARKEARSAAQTVQGYLEDVYEPKVLRHAKGGAATKARILSKKGGTWKPLLGLPLAELTRDAIEKVLAARKDAKKAAGTLIRDWGAFRALLADAVDRGHLSAIPMARRPEPIRKLQGAKRVRYLGQRDTDEERAAGNGEEVRFGKALAAFTSPATGGGDFLRFAAGLALATGMRRGEIVRLTQAMINKRERRIELTAAVTKNGKPRTVFLSDAALAALDLWKIRGTGGELCTGTSLSWEQRITLREWPRLCAEAKLEDFHFHDLRHCFAARLVMAGRPLIEVRDALGHASVVTTEIYAHLAPSRVRDAVLALGRAPLTPVQ